MPIMVAMTLGMAVMMLMTHFSNCNDGDDDHGDDGGDEPLVMVMTMVME